MLCILHITAHGMNKLSHVSLKVKQIVIPRCMWDLEKYFTFSDLFDLFSAHSIATF